jgi:hypothetical protein
MVMNVHQITTIPLTNLKQLSLAQVNAIPNTMFGEYLARLYTPDQLQKGFKKTFKGLQTVIKAPNLLNAIGTYIPPSFRTQYTQMLTTLRKSDQGVSIHKSINFLIEAMQPMLEKQCKLAFTTNTFCDRMTKDIMAQLTPKILGIYKKAPDFNASEANLTDIWGTTLHHFADISDVNIIVKEE